jgi:HAE1 family hydrophobic/amphiphilic exporter-1
VRLQLDPNKLAGLGLTVSDVATAVANANVNLPTGTLYGPYTALTVEASGQLMTARDYGPLIVTYRNGAPVRLSDVGQAIDSVENNKVAAWYVDSQSHQRSVILAVQRQPGTNTVEVANAVKNLLPAFRLQLPASVSLHILYDRSESIRASINDVQVTMVVTLVLVITVIFLFLRSVYATVIPSLALPISIIFTFADFNIVYVLTQGGPMNYTHLFATLANMLAFQTLDLGRGAAVSLFMFPLLVLLVFFILRLARREY